MSVQHVRHLEIGHWVIVSDGRYVGRRAQIVGRHRETLRLLINGGPRNPVRIKIANVQREIAGAQIQHRVTTLWPTNLTAKQGPWRVSAFGADLACLVRSLLDGLLDRWRRAV